LYYNKVIGNSETGFLTKISVRMQKLS